MAQRRVQIRRQLLVLAHGLLENLYTSPPSNRKQGRFGIVVAVLKTGDREGHKRPTLSILDLGPPGGKTSSLSGSSLSPRLSPIASFSSLQPGFDACSLSRLAN